MLGVYLASDTLILCKVPDVNMYTCIVLLGVEYGWETEGSLGLAGQPGSSE